MTPDERLREFASRVPDPGTSWLAMAERPKTRRERFGFHEFDLAVDDARRDAIDRIAQQCAMAGIDSATDVVAAIRDGLEHEMPRLVAVPLTKRDRGIL